MGRDYIAIALTSLLTLAGPTLWSTGASAEYRLDGPFTYDNLSLYRIHDGAAKVSAPLDVGTAVKQGLVKFHAGVTTGINVTADNLSDRAVFVQFGTLLEGATQDQVVGTEFILPPRSTGTPIDIFCVEKGRWEPRAGEDAANYSTTGTLLPANMARLGILAGSAHSRVAARLRQLGVWISVDDMLRNLSDSTGTPIARVMWPTSLPEALKNPALESAERRYLDALQPKGESGDTIGVVFAINGKLWSADVYSSGELFRRMWPNLLQAGITEAIAAKRAVFEAPPEVSRVNAFLSEGAAAPTIDEIALLSRGIEKRDGNSVAYYESGSGGHWLHRGYLAKDNPGAPTITLQHTVLKMLETGEVSGRRSIASTGEIGDQAFQTQLLSNIALDNENQILRSANIESYSSERSRALLEPILNRTREALVPAGITDRPRPVAQTPAEDSAIFKWFIPPLLLLVLYAAAAVYLMVRHSWRHTPLVMRNDQRGSDCQALPVVISACGQSQVIHTEIEQQDLVAIACHGSGALPEWDDADPLWFHDDGLSIVQPAPCRIRSRSPSASVVETGLTPLSPALFICATQKEENKSIVSVSREEQRNELMEAA